jgi:hypothetical protein
MGHSGTPFWVAEHPEHVSDRKPLSQRPVLIYAGGTLEKPKNVHAHVWPQLSDIGELDLAIVDFGRLGFLRSNGFQEQRVREAVTHLVEQGYSPRLMALSGGSKGAYASARAATSLREQGQELAALILVSPVVSAKTALTVLRSRMSSHENTVRLAWIVDLLLKAVDPKFLDITELPLDGDLRTFVVQGGKDWANDVTTNSQLREHFGARF